MSPERVERRCLLCILMLSLSVVIGGVILVLRVARQRQVQGEKEACTLGILADVPLGINGVPDQGVMLARYARLVHALYPHAEEDMPIMTVDDLTVLLQGQNAEIAVEIPSGRVQSVADRLRDDRELAATGIRGSPFALQGYDAADIEKEMRGILLGMLGISIPADAAFMPCFKKQYEDRETFSCAWYMRYHGYVHEHDAIHALAVRENGALHLVHAVNAGRKEEPEIPAIAVAAGIARQEASRAARSCWSSLYGDAVSVGDVKVEGPVFTYRSSFLQDTQDTAKIVIEARSRMRESVLSYRVRVKGMADVPDGQSLRLELIVYVSCEDGAAVDAYESVREPLNADATAE